MKVAALEKFGRGGDGDQDPGDPGVGKVRGGEDFFSFKQEKVGGRGGGDGPGWHCANIQLGIRSNWIWGNVCVF